MPHKNDLLFEFRAQRIEIAEQHIELQRQRRQMELQIRRTADIQGQLDRLQMAVERAAHDVADVRGPAVKSLPAKRTRAN
jgi:hypothetical protein